MELPRLTKVVNRFMLVFTGITILIALSSWGYYAHHRINRLAVFILPKAMSGFYKANIGYITEHAISPDKRRYVDSAEASKHFLDADHYGKKPFANIPRKWRDAAKKYSADTLNKYGTVPWAIQSQYYRLVEAFKKHDTTTILNASSYLGHYVADAHVPLHLHSNHDGQLSGQQGIHALWESRIPALFASGYNCYAGKARYIENPLDEAFKICRASFSKADSVLRLERQLNRTFPALKKYEAVIRGNRKVKDYSAAYAAAYQRLLRGMVHRRMRSSVLSVSSFWFSAWVDAGQPDLNKLIVKPLSQTEKLKLQKEEAVFRSGKIAPF